MSEREIDRWRWFTVYLPEGLFTGEGNPIPIALDTVPKEYPTQESPGPEDPENGPSGPNDPNGGGGGIDRTGPLLTQQYDSRDTLRQAASQALQKIVLLFGIIIAAFTFIDKIGESVDIFNPYISAGFLVLMVGVLSGSFVLVRTSSVPRPEAWEVIERHHEINEKLFQDEQNDEISELESLSDEYFRAVSVLRQRNAILGKLIGLTVSATLIGALSIGSGIFELSVSELPPSWAGVLFLFSVTIAFVALDAGSTDSGLLNCIVESFGDDKNTISVRENEE